ncbi:unnamed protein product [Victoria cruziana]
MRPVSEERRDERDRH